VSRPAQIWSGLWVAGLIGVGIWGAGCAGTKEVARPTSTGPAPTKLATLQAPLISSHSKLLFEEAVKDFEAQKKTNVFDYSSLERKFQAVLEDDPNFAEAEYNLGVIAQRLGRVDLARSHYQSALRLKPSLTEAAENLAVIAQNAGNVLEAAQVYNKLLAIRPEDSRVRVRVAEMQRDAGDCDKAMDLARQALIHDPRTLEAYRVMMLCYLDRKQVSMAKLVVLRALKLDERNPDLHHALGLIFLQEKEPTKAHLEFKSALAGRSDYIPSRVMLAKLAIEEGNYPGAEEHLRRLAQTYRNNADLHLDLGVAYKGMAQYDKAMQEYDIAEKLNPELAEVYLDRAIILHRHKDAPERAVQLYKKYIQIAGGEAALPSDAPVFALLQEAQQISQVKLEAKLAQEQAKKVGSTAASSKPKAAKGDKDEPAEKH